MRSVSRFLSQESGGVHCSCSRSPASQPVVGRVKEDLSRAHGRHEILYMAGPLARPYTIFHAFHLHNEVLETLAFKAHMPQTHEAQREISPTDSFLAPFRMVILVRFAHTGMHSPFMALRSCYLVLMFCCGPLAK